jgi:hypothetical protein
MAAAAYDLVLSSSSPSMPDSCVAACVSAAGDTRGPALANTSSNA